SQLGARCQYLGNPGRPPLKITGPVTGNRAEISGDISSQFVSSLLIACSQKSGDTDIILKGQLRSRPYVDITLQMLREFGADVEEKDQRFFVKGTQKLTRETYTVPGDYSSASFPLVAAAITGGEVTVKGLDLDSPQGDKAILQHLRSFGARVSLGKDSVKVSGGELKGTEIDVTHTPDLFPVLAVLGSVASGRTILKGGENLRAKESDRIATTTTFLQDMGARIVPRDDGCEVLGGDKLHGTTIQTEGDHRILMAAAIAGLVSSSETKIDDNYSFNVSYPGFLRDMHQLGCRMEVRK
ncbi:MAG: 3-phosphoshikimate 1-carboxyvinyltransferase, partial [Candidatus Thermoplasmatota archaeon]|nr:3-phosphoshikimate 1-carboxyvinyltransferase [Candidatus Thermoplasmatota archaeon]